MALTRFYDRQTDRDGPVSGALQVLPVQFDDIANSETAIWKWTPPAGMSFEIVDIYVTASATTSDPLLTIGTTAAGTQVVASVTLVTDLGSATLKTTSVTSGDVLDVRIVADSGDAAESVSVTITGYVSAPPTSELHRS